jgi:hypothetical protein
MMAIRLELNGRRRKNNVRIRSSDSKKKLNFLIMPKKQIADMKKNTNVSSRKKLGPIKSKTLF